MIELITPPAAAVCSVNHPLALLEGYVTRCLAPYVTIHNKATGSVVNWPVVQSKFTSFVLLTQGPNEVSLHHGFYTKTLTLCFTPPTTLYTVQPVYMVFKGTDGTFQAPECCNRSIDSACNRIGLATAMLQTFCYHSLRRTIRFREPRTFHTNIDRGTCLPYCHVFHSKYSVEDIYAMTQSEVWKNLAQELVKSPQLPHSSTTKYLVFLSCTRYDGAKWSSEWRHRDLIAATKGYVAVGGGGLAVIGTGTLHTWADSLQNMTACLTDERQVNRQQFLDDSAYRHSYWANYSTGLGAALHELGHTLDLAHTVSGIMNRGDNIHRFFVLEGAFAVEQPDTQMVAKYQRLSQALRDTRKAVSTPIPQCLWKVDVLLPEMNMGSVELQLQDQNTGGNDIRRMSVKTSQLKSPTHPSSHTSAMSLVTTPACAAPGGLVEALPLSSTSDMTNGFWCSNSAVMIYYSRWFMACDTIAASEKPFGNSRQSLYFHPFTASTPQVTIQTWARVNHSRHGDPTSIIVHTTHYVLCTNHFRQVKANSGLRTVQIYTACEDNVIVGEHYIHTEAPTALNTDDLVRRYQRQLQRVKHCATCQSTCLELHIRDNAGHFLKIKL